MMEKIKNIFSSHPIAWTLLTLVVVIGLGLLVWYIPAFSLQAADIPVQESIASEHGEPVPFETVVTNGKAKRKGETIVVLTWNHTLQQGYYQL